MAGFEEEKAQLNYELAVYKEQISLIKQETERISLTTVDLSNALSTIESFEKADEKTSMLVPIGGGAMMKGVLAKAEIIVPIGSGYLVHMSQKEAADEVKKRIEATKKAIEKLSDEFEKIATKLKETSIQLGKMETDAELSHMADSNIREDYI